MAKVCIIKFSADDITVDGKDLAAEREKNIVRHRLTANREPTDEEKKVIEENITSKRDVEKIILQSLLQVYANEKENKKLSKYNIILDICSTIDNSDDKVTISRDEMNWFSEAFEKIPERIPAQWRFCRELISQLDKREEVETDPAPVPVAKE